MSGRARSSSGNRRGSDEDNTHHAIRTIRRKLRDSRVKVATIVHRCEVKDRNRDGLVHIDDLEDILNDVTASEHRITRRELIRFSATIVSERNDGKIQYEKISDILEPKSKKGSEDNENWVDIEEDEGDTKWATQPGISKILLYIFATYICLRHFCVSDTAVSLNDNRYDRICWSIFERIRLPL